MGQRVSYHGSIEERRAQIARAHQRRLNGDPPLVALLVIGDRGMHLDAEISFATNAVNLDLVSTVRVNDANHRLGFCGAWKRGMRLAAETVDADYVFHLEEDFTFNRGFDVSEMVDVLHEGDAVYQVALKRNPVEGEPVGGFMAAWPGAYDQRYTDGGAAWLAHKLFATTNPNLVTRMGALMASLHLPPPPACERAWGESLTKSGWQFAYMGTVEGPPWVTHTAERKGVGY